MMVARSVARVVGWRPGRLWPGFAVTIAFALFAGPASAQISPLERIEDVGSYYGGYLPVGGFPKYSGAPLGGYTPWGYNRLEGGWLKLHYGDRYVVFNRSYSFGEQTVGGPRESGTAYFATEYRPHPPEYGRGVWNSYGSTLNNPRADIWKRQGNYGRVPPP